MAFKGLNFAIVGGTTGLGFSAAKALVAARAKVGICGRSTDSLEKALTELGEHDAIGISGDASDSGTAETLIAEIVSRFGRLRRALPRRRGQRTLAGRRTSS